MDIEKVDIEEHISNYRTEGETGVKNLCKMARLLGYKDNTHFGQFQGGCYGDLISFFQSHLRMQTKVLILVETMKAMTFTKYRMNTV